MTQLCFPFAITHGSKSAERGPCASCKTVGRWKTAECGVCRKEAKQEAKRRQYTRAGLDRSGR